MADKGKSKLDPEMLRREEEDREKRQRIEEAISRWWATQRDITFNPPVPLNFRPPHLLMRTSTGQPNTTGQAGTSGSKQGQIIRGEAYRQEATLPTIASSEPLPTVVTDQITRQDLQGIWDRLSAPIPPDRGPWYRFAKGHVRFRYGMTWERIDMEERKLARERGELRAQGQNVTDKPPSPLPDEHLLEVINSDGESLPNDDEDPMEWFEDNEEADQEGNENVNDAGNGNENVHLAANGNGNANGFVSDSDADSDDLPDWSSTSTVTTEPTRVPPNHRRTF